MFITFGAASVEELMRDVVQWQEIDYEIVHWQIIKEPGSQLLKMLMQYQLTPEAVVRERREGEPWFGEKQP